MGISSPRLFNTNRSFSLNAYPDLNEQLKKGHVITLDGKYVYATNVIYTGMDIIEIREIDQKASTYNADFYLWFRYKPKEQDPEFQA